VLPFIIREIQIRNLHKFTFLVNLCGFIFLPYWVWGLIVFEIAVILLQEFFYRKGDKVAQRFFKNILIRLLLAFAVFKIDGSVTCGIK
jgi:hypothetical protein